jgi:hypothetical protein
MGGQWVTSRELFENGVLTNQITQMNMAIQMNECGAQGTLGESGKIFNAGFAGRVANNLAGKWTLDGEEGTFHIQLQDREKDCASFDGYMSSGDKTWKWTGHKEAMSPLSSCNAECKQRDPHLNWNGDTSQYPYCNCVCEAGWEFDASGKSCVPAGTSEINPCEAECKARAPAGQLSHMVWNGDTSQYPYCNCVCEAGWEFDVSGKSCVPAETSNPASSDAKAQVTTPEGIIPVNSGKKTQIILPPGKGASIDVICSETRAKIDLISLLYGKYVAEWEKNKMPEHVQFLMWTYVLNYAQLCDKNGIPSYSPDTAASNLPESSANEIKVELQEGPLRAEIINDQVSLDIETPTVIVSSQGKNTFEVAYDPKSGKSLVTAYQYPIQVQPTDGSQAPFTLESGQEVEISNGQVRQATPSGQMPGEEKARNPGFVPEGSEGGCYADPLTGEITCLGSNGEPSGAQGGQKNGCYQDPNTGQYVCVDSYGESESYQEGTQGDGSQDLCYEDPETGETVCTGSSGGPSNI